MTTTERNRINATAHRKRELIVKMAILTQQRSRVNGFARSAPPNPTTEESALRKFLKNIFYRFQISHI